MYLPCKGRDSVHFYFMYRYPTIEKNESDTSPHITPLIAQGQYGYFAFAP